MSFSQQTEPGTAYPRASKNLVLTGLSWSKYPPFPNEGSSSLSPAHSSALRKLLGLLCVELSPSTDKSESALAW